MLTSLKHQLASWAKRLLYSKRGEPYHIRGFVLRYMPGSRPVRVSYKNSSNVNVRYDALQVDLFSSDLQPGDTAIDIGAHHGQYCILMAAACGAAGNVVAFEPDPYAREMLACNLALNPGLKPPRVEPFALSDTDGEAVLYSRGGNSQSSLARSGTEFAADHHSESIHVRTMRLDTYLEQNKSPVPKWVKIDAEGAEIRILRGAPRLLGGTTRIICELHPYAWPEFGNDYAELQRLITQAGRCMHYLGSTEEMPASAAYGTVLIEPAAP